MAGDPYSAALTGIGLVGGIASDIFSRRDARRNRQQLENQIAQQRLERGRIADLLEGRYLQDIQGVEDPMLAAARFREESLARQQLGRGIDRSRQGLIDRFARLGAATGRQAADITAPAAQATLRGVEQMGLDARRQLAIDLASQAAQRREVARRSAMGQLQGISEFRTGAPILSPGASSTYGQAAFGQAFGLGIQELLRSRRKNSEGLNEEQISYEPGGGLR